MRKVGYEDEPGGGAAAVDKNETTEAKTDGKTGRRSGRARGGYTKNLLRALLGNEIPNMPCCSDGRKVAMPAGADM